MIHLDNRTHMEEEEVVKLFHKSIYTLMEKAYFLINDTEDARRYRRKIHRECGDRAEEGNSAMEIANCYLRQGHDRHVKVKEAADYVNVGSMFLKHGNFLKAKENVGKALAIRRKLVTEIEKQRTAET